MKWLTDIGRGAVRNCASVTIISEGRKIVRSSYICQLKKSIVIILEFFFISVEGCNMCTAKQGAVGAHHPDRA